MMTGFMYLIFMICNCDSYKIHNQRNEPYSEYQRLWKNELLNGNLQSVYNVFADHNLFATEFLLYINIDAFIEISKELCLDLDDMEIYKLSIIAWKIHHHQNMIDDVGIHYLQDEDGNDDEYEYENDPTMNNINGEIEQKSNTRNNKRRGFGIYI
mmetsp:Transcript_22831/g.20059  ORF Transcript_22831/g.20059 Transcript_22831/m.20059 type:complete len:155 (-) Transcript_22831:55-519(-)